MKRSEQEAILRVRDVAGRLDISAGTVYALVAAGRLRCTRVGLGRGVIRISEEQLAEYLKAAEPEVNAPTRTPRTRLKHLRL